MVNHNGGNKYNDKYHSVRIEKSVNLLIGHRQPPQWKADPRKYDESKAKHTTTIFMKNPKGKHNDLENKLYRKEKKKEEEEEHPNMIDTDGWVRPNRAMWASPPDSSCSHNV
ncbi:unnamed protein product [Cochlearia groenlandica]